jgi:hypothetical protein
MKYMKLQLKQLKLFSSSADFCVKTHVILYGPFPWIKEYLQPINPHS